MAIHGIHAILLDDVNLTQCTQVSISPGIADLIVAAGGQVDPTFVAVSKASPGITFTTTEIKRVLDKLDETGVPMDGLSIVAGTDAPVIVYFQLHPQYGTRSTDNDFISVTITDCLVTPQALDVQDGQAAAISLNITPAISTGVNVVTVATGVNNPAITMTVDQQYTAGPIKINTASIDVANFNNVQSGSMGFGIDVATISGDGVIYSKIAYIRSRNPTITAQLTDATAFTELLDSGEMIGVPQGANDSTLFLRKIDDDGTRVADNIAEHIAIIVDGGRITTSTFAATGQEAASSGIRILPRFAGTNPIVVFNTAIAIS